jgi:hypothetical protein
MSAQTAVLEMATIRQQCKVLHLPTVAAQCGQLAEQAVRERRTHLGFLDARTAGPAGGYRERRVIPCGS